MLHFFDDLNEFSEGFDGKISVEDFLNKLISRIIAIDREPSKIKLHCELASLAKEIREYLDERPIAKVDLGVPQSYG